MIQRRMHHVHGFQSTSTPSVSIQSGLTQTTQSIKENVKPNGKKPVVLNSTPNNARGVIHPSSVNAVDNARPKTKLSGWLIDWIDRTSNIQPKNCMYSLIKYHFFKL